VVVAEYDLVVVTCRHDSFGPAVWNQAAVVLDATYTLPDASNCFVP